MGSLARRKTPYMKYKKTKTKKYTYSHILGWIGQPTYEKVNEELFLDNPLHIILIKSKLAYRIYVILIDNNEPIKNISSAF
jgi:hypothetical protein